MKYNKSEIFKNAWAMVKKAGMTISAALKKAWEMAKGTIKEQMIAKMEMLVSMATPVMNYRIVAKDWVKYGKDRTYLKIIETRNHSKHYIEYDFGFIDNNTNEYVAGRRDLTERYTLAGSSF